MTEHRTVADASAVVLAGGKSSRMGSPKALLRFDDEPILAHIVRTLSRMFAEIIVVAAPDQELPSLPVTVVRDQVVHQGPVGGLCYGLKATGTDFSFVTSCDVAFLNPELISYLVSRISEYDVVVPHWQQRLQPLHAVYRRSVLPLLEDQLARAQLRPVYLFDRVRTCRVDEDEIRRFDPEGLSFLNMNTPQDYEEALRRWNPGVTCMVELFGVARLLAKTKELSLSLPSGATLSHVYAALGAALPILSGRVISADGSSLLPGYACNVNGVDFVRAATATVRSGDRILILSADAGG
jgi:molybdopterin-guanine dinucleotide biosynthesis protein A/molybdopterin converting factor small subunit